MTAFQTTSLISPNGSFNRPAIKAAVAARVSSRQDWLSQWSGEPLKFWRHQIWKQAVDAVRREASRQRDVFIAARAKVSYSRQEREELARLDAAAEACPISFKGNLDAQEFRAAATAVRDRAERAARGHVIARIAGAARAAHRRAA